MAFYNAIRILSTIFFFSILVVGYGMEEEDEYTLRISGMAIIPSEPDVVTIQTGVITEAKTARDALNMNNEAFSEIRVLLERQGVAEKDLVTLDFEVKEQFERFRNGRRGNFTGYRVSNELQIKIRDLDSLSEVLDSLVTAGSNSIKGIEFSVDDPTPLVDQARVEAIEDAKDTAALYAKYSGVKLGRLIRISESRLRAPRSSTPSFRRRASRGFFGNGGRGGRGGRGGNGAIIGDFSIGGIASGGEVDSSVTVSALFAITN